MSCFHVDVLPEGDGSFTLWLRELNAGGYRRTLQDARRDLLAAIGSYMWDYIQQFAFYRDLPDLACQEPYVMKLSLARDEAEMIRILFGTEAESAANTTAG